MRLYRKKYKSYDDRYVPTPGTQAELIEACLSARTWKSAERIRDEILSESHEVVNLGRIRQHLKYNLEVRRLMDVKEAIETRTSRKAIRSKAPTARATESRRSTLRRLPRKLEKLLLPAYAPCPAFKGTCVGTVKWKPSAGHVPRGFRGATGSLADVGLVLVCDAPGNPFDGEGLDPQLGPGDYLRAVYMASCSHVERRVHRFGQNVHYIIEEAWPGLPFDEQFRKTWLTETVLCSPPRSGDPVPLGVERECMERYLLGQLALFANARVVALGRRAQERLKRASIPFRSAPHPSTRMRLSDARRLWKDAVSGLKA